MMTDLRRVSSTEIALGVPMPWSVYDQEGRLLLKVGHTINIERDLEVLLSNGLFVHKNDAGEKTADKSVQSSDTVFSQMDSVKLSLWRLFQRIKSRQQLDGVIPRIEVLAAQVEGLCDQDTDAAIANLHIDFSAPYCVLHHLQAALLCSLVGRRIGIDFTRRLALVKAALTHDIGILGFQDCLEKQTDPLTTAQLAVIRAHPVDSALLLRSMGVTDSDWLDAVLHHHERLDGSGYPDKLHGANIQQLTRVLSVADIFSAMVRDRPYRKAVMTHDAMRTLLLEQGNGADHMLAQAMIKEIGVFPPGSLVKLRTGEIGVVHMRTNDTSRPKVKLFAKPDGSQVHPAHSRDGGWCTGQIEGMISSAAYARQLSTFGGLWGKSLTPKAA